MIDCSSPFLGQVCTNRKRGCLVLNLLLLSTVKTETQFSWLEVEAYGFAQKPSRGEHALIDTSSYSGHIAYFYLKYKCCSCFGIDRYLLNSK